PTPLLPPEPPTTARLPAFFYMFWYQSSSETKPREEKIPQSSCHLVDTAGDLKVRAADCVFLPPFLPPADHEIIEQSPTASHVTRWNVYAEAAGSAQRIFCR
ncbi:hypothetical protein Bbelb_433190, partial [Branchiostoma belcheri]